MALRFDRTQKLFKEKFSQLQSAKVLILGVGGVGGYALDCLYRTGVGSICIVDFDTFDETNQNRQIGSEHIGEVKVWVLQRLYQGIDAIEAKITPAWVEAFDFEPFDVVIDAIDDVGAKVALIKKCHKKLICSTGSAKKIDPTKIEIASIWKTHTDPLAKALRERLKKERFSKNVTTIFSTEPARTKDLGSFVGVTGSFGLSACAQTIERLIR